MAIDDPKPSARPPRVLLVDDSAEGRRALAKLLETKGYDVVAVGTGQAALEAMQQMPPPEIVLTDIQLPDIDGREVAQAARLLVPTPYIALITGWSLDAQLRDPAHLGVHGIFLKPIRLEELLAELTQALGKPRTTDGSA
ncbi:MAG TPA: response regulator [Isosphaeraceae bacterium]|jgi:CheY-like chemotaxis protein|nr:response regulator [Isosphaeraceae bacterium]